MAATNQQSDQGIRVDIAELIALRLRARGFKLGTPRRITSTAAGTSHSRFRGRGVDYVESRGYQPGDDIRHMDWRVTARTGRPHTKLFQEERERAVLVILDCNATLRFGTRLRFKSVQAARVAALLAWISVQNGNRIGALGFGGGIRAEVKPTGGQRGALRCLRAFSDWDHQVDEAAPPTALSDALLRARRLVHPGGLVILLSDGFSADAAAAIPLSALAAHCDVAAVLFSDALEMRAPPPGRYAVRIGASDSVIDFSAETLRVAWPKLFAQRRDRLLQLMSQCALPWMTLDTRAEPGSDFIRLLAGLKPRRAL